MRASLLLSVLAVLALAAHAPAASVLALGGLAVIVGVAFARAPR